MRRMRNSNVNTVLDPYLYCGKKRNKPRIHHKICEERCKKFKECPYYGEWYREYYGEDVEKKKIKPKRKKVARRTRKKIKKKKYKTKVVSV